VVEPETEGEADVNVIVSVSVVRAAASVTDTVAVPSAPVVTDARATVSALAPETEGVRTTPDTGAPKASVTVAVNTFVLSSLTF